MLDAVALHKRMERLRVRNAMLDAHKNRTVSAQAALANRITGHMIKLQEDLQEALEFKGMVIRCLMRIPPGEMPTWALPLAVDLEDQAERTNDADD